MTRRLGGFRSRGSTALASISLAVALAGGAVAVGCGGGDNGNGNTTIVDSGSDTGTSGDTGVTDSGVKDTGLSSDAPTDSPTTDASDAGLKQLLPPTFKPVDGTVDPGTVTILPGAGTPTGNSFILYTTDGTLPTRSSPAYSGPIQITQATTIHAFVVALGFLDSPIATASYTVTPPEAGSLVPPTFKPASQTAINDIPVAVSSSNGAQICYTTDGVTTPTCNANGACTGTSQPYNATAGILINGTITDPNTGKVTVQAIACQSGFTTTAVVSQQYTLIAAPPVMIQPVPSTLVFQENAQGTAEVPYTPTIKSDTNNSKIYYTTGSSPPSCVGTGGGGIGTGVANPHTFGGPASPTDGLVATTTYQAITCKAGYAPSPVTANPYIIQLNQPGFPLAKNGPGAPGTYNDVVPAFTLVDTNADTSTALEWFCYTMDGSSPSCGATQATCGETSATAITLGQQVPSITKTGTVLNVVACNLGLAQSTVQTGTYTLQLPQAALAAPGVDVATFAPLAGYHIPAGMVTTPATFTPNVEEDVLTSSGTATATVTLTNGAITAITLKNGGYGYSQGTVNVSFSDPAGAGATATATVTNGVVTGLNLTHGGAGYVSPTVAISGAGRLYGFACVALNGPATCGTGACTAGMQVAFAGGLNTDGTLAVGAMPSAVSPSDAWTVVGCPTNGDVGNFLPSLPVTVTYAGATQALQPTITPASSPPPYTNGVGPTIANTDPNGVTVCYTTDGTVPTCTPLLNALPGNDTCGDTSNTGNVMHAALTGVGSSATYVSQFVVAPGNGGSGYTSPPAVALSGGGFTKAATAGALMAVNNVAITNGGSGYAGTVTVTFWQGSTQLPTTGSNAVVGSVNVTPAGTISQVQVTSGGHGITGHVTAEICGTSGGSTAATGNFNQCTPSATAVVTLAVDGVAITDSSLTQVPPTFCSGPPFANTNCGGAGYSSAPTVTIPNANGGSGASATASLSNAIVLAFDGSYNNGNDIEESNHGNVQATVCNASENPPAAVVSNNYTFQMAEPDFTSLNYYTGKPTGSVNNLDTAPAAGIGIGDYIGISTTSVFNSDGEFLYWTWDGTNANCGSTLSSDSSSGYDYVPQPGTNGVPAGTSVTLNAVACSTVSTAAQATSPQRSVTFNVHTSDPIITTDQATPNCTPGNVYTRQSTLDGSYGCPPQANWENSVHVAITDSTPNATLCWSLNGTPPTCTPGANTATCVTATGGDSPGTLNGLTIDNSGTKVIAVACETLGTATSTSNTVSTQPFVLNVTPVVASPAVGSVNATCNATITLGLDTSATSLNLGGPTDYADICWTTDGSQAQCPGSTVTTNTSNCLSYYNSNGTNNDGRSTNASYGVTINLSGNINTITCSPTQTLTENIPGVSLPFNYNLAGYRNKAPIIIDGNNSEWVNSNGAGENFRMSGCGGNDQGFFTYDASNLYFAQTYGSCVSGLTATDYVAVYIGNGSPGGAITGPTAMGSPSLPQYGSSGPNANKGMEGIVYAFYWQGLPGTGSPTALKYNGTTWVTADTVGAWVMAPTSPTSSSPAFANSSNNATVEFSIPISELPLLGAGGLQTVTVIESLVANVGATPSIDEATGSGNLTSGFRDAYNSCQFPNQQLFGL